jgi:polyisoprenoid-binding protein YceI
VSDHDEGSSPTAGVAALIGGGAGAGRWVLDPNSSHVEFHVKHFWGAITVHGSFATMSGEASVGADGTITGRLNIAAASVTTKNKRRDEHLRSGDFFDAENHPEVVVNVTEATPVGPTSLTCRGTLETAGHSERIEFRASVDDASADAVTLRAEIAVDRTEFAMTWSPMGMAAKTALARVVARFIRP